MATYQINDPTYSVRVITGDGQRFPALCRNRVNNDGKLFYEVLVLKVFMPRTYVEGIGADYDEMVYCLMTTDNPEAIERLQVNKRVYRSWRQFVHGRSPIDLSIAGLRLLIENWQDDGVLLIESRDYVVTYYEIMIHGVKIEITNALPDGILARQHQCRDGSNEYRTYTWSLNDINTAF